MKPCHSQFNEAWERYHARLYLLAFRYLKSREAAEDAVQQVYMRYWEIIGAKMDAAEQDVLRTPYALLYTMMKHHVLNEVRNHTTRLAKAWVLAQNQNEADEALMENLFREETHRAFYNAVERMPRQRREVVMLRVYEGLSLTEVAQKMGLSINTVKSHWRAALADLRSQLGELSLLIFLLWVLYY